MSAKTELLITVDYIGRIPPLYQDGPIITPIRVSLATATTLVMNQYKVFEHNSYNPSERIRLTLDNIRTNNFEIPISKVHVEEESAPPIPMVTKKVEEDSAEKFFETVTEEAPIPNSTEEKQESDIVEVSSEDSHVNKPVSLQERATALGIDTTGMSKNKIKAAIKEKEAEKTEA